MGDKEAAFMAKLLATFKVEAEEHLKNLNEGLLALEKTGLEKPSAELLQTVFREAHSLKGAARSVNHDVIQLICQSVESVFSALKHQQITFSPVIFDTLYASLDLITKLLETPQKTESKILVAEMIAKLDALLIPFKAIVKEPSKESLVTESANIASKPTANIKQPNNVPEQANLTDVPQDLKIESPEQTLLKNKQEKVAEVKVEPLPTKVETSSSHETHSHSADKTVRVSLSKLDKLFQQTEELLTIKMASQQQLSSLKLMGKLLKEWKKESMHLQKDIENTQYHEGKKDNNTSMFFELHHRFIDSLNEALSPLIRSTNIDFRFLGGMIDSLLDDTKKLLMQPFSTLLETFPRMVRDLSHQLGKEVQLDVQGAGIEIDRRILEEIKDPLIHLIRNSLDHGIEIPEERKKKGKISSGTIKVIASQLSGNSVEIIVADDGGGISLDILKQSAVKNKILSQKEADLLSDEESIKLIFHSGISTSKIVTNLSGRGLGMGIVGEKVDKLGGRLSVESKSSGTSIKIVLPLTLATFRGIQLKVCDRDFVMPTHNVQRVLKIDKKEIKSVENRSMVSIDGCAYSYVHLKDVLGIAQMQTEINDDSLTIIIVKAAEQVIAFGVDAILNEQEILVKRFGKQLTRVKNILSATVMEMGKVIPILNPSDLVKSIILENYHSTNPTILQNETAENRTKKILLAEDSVTTRMLLKNILEASGYDVIVAVDGAEAFRMLKETQVDLLLTDIEMPNMDGFTLVENVRKINTLQNLPVILCTSLCSPADREKGIEVGAQAYLDKSSFTQGHLLDVIKKLL